MIGVHLVRRDGLGCVRLPIRPGEQWQVAMARKMYDGATYGDADRMWRLWRSEAWAPGPCDGRCRIPDGEEDEDHG